MAVPIMLAASGLSLLKHYQDIQIADIPFLYFRLLAAFTVGLIAIKTFLHLINKIKLIPAIYRIVLVIFIAILYFGFGMVKVFNFLLKYRLSIKEPLDWQFYCLLLKHLKYLIVIHYYHRLY